MTYSKLSSLVEAYAWKMESEVRKLIIQRLEQNSSTLISLEDYRNPYPTMKSVMTQVDEFRAKGGFLFATKKISEVIIFNY